MTHRVIIRVGTGLLAIAGLSAFVPGSNTTFVNASNATIRIQCKTVNRSYPSPMILGRAQRMSLSGDFGDLLSLTVRYTSGKSVKLTRDDLNHIKVASGLSHGVWWITDSGVQYISSRDANLRQRQLTGGTL